MSAPVSDLIALHRLIRLGGGPETTATALEIIKRMQEKGENVDGVDYIDGYSPLRRAALLGRLEIADALIKAGADVNKFYGGWSPLIGAVMNNKVELVKLLLTAGADKEAKAYDGSTPLFLASDKGFLEIVNALIEAGADVNAKTDDGASPLFIATQEGHEGVAKALLAAGAKVMEPNWKGKSVFKWATEEDEEWGNLFPPATKALILKHTLEKGDTKIPKGRQEVRNMAFNRRKHAVNAFLKIRGNVGGGRRTRHRRHGRRSTRKA